MLNAERFLIMWVLIEERLGNNDAYISSLVSTDINKIIVECSVFGKETWNFAGHAFISDNDIQIISLQKEQIFLQKPQLIIINPEILELLSNFFYIWFEPKSWIAEWGYTYRLYEWQP